MANSIRDIATALNGVTPAEVATTRQLAPTGIRQASSDISAGVNPISDHTSLSEMGGLLGAVKRIANSLSSFRTDLVTGIKQQVTSGQYNPNPSAVAQRVVRALNQKVG
jgi:anti-sigma28 factor (negative regulator of flagellin synthesis)